METNTLIPGTNSPENQGAPTQIQPRLVSAKCALSDIVEGHYFEVSGKWEPDYVITPFGQRVSRVNLIGVVVAVYLSEDGNYATATIDDGSETIRMKVFKGDVKLVKDLQIGKVVSVIGKVRKYRDEVYVAPETIVNSDTDHEILRSLEILKSRRKLAAIKELVGKTSAEFDDPGKMVEFLSSKYGLSKEAVEAILISQTPVSADTQSQEADEAKEGASEDSEPAASAKSKQLILLEIEKAGGQGLDYSLLVKAANLPKQEVDSCIKELIAEGEIFEPKSGRFKRLL